MKLILLCIVASAFIVATVEAMPLKNQVESFEGLYSQLAHALRRGLVREELGPAIEKYNRLVPLARPEDGLMLNIIHRDLTREIDRFKATTELPSGEVVSNGTSSAANNSSNNSVPSNDHLSMLGYPLYSLWGLHGATLFALFIFTRVLGRLEGEIDKLASSSRSPRKSIASEVEPLTTDGKSSA